MSALVFVTFGILMALSNAAAVAAITAVGKFWVKSPKRAMYPSTRAAYALFFLDGLEFLLSRTSLALGLARDLLVFKLAAASAGSKKASPPPPLAPPIMPVIAPKLEPTAVDVAALADEIMSSTSSTKEKTPSPTAVRKRAKILPPSGPSPVNV